MRRAIVQMRETAPAAVAFTRPRTIFEATLPASPSASQPKPTKAAGSRASPRCAEMPGGEQHGAQRERAEQRDGEVERREPVRLLAMPASRPRAAGGTTPPISLPRWPSAASGTSACNAAPSAAEPDAASARRSRLPRRCGHRASAEPCKQAGEEEIGRLASGTTASVTTNNSRNPRPASLPETARAAVRCRGPRRPPANRRGGLPAPAASRRLRVAGRLAIARKIVRRSAT